jgi:hypothetical protein
MAGVDWVVAGMMLCILTVLIGLVGSLVLAGKGYAPNRASLARADALPETP